MKSRILEDMARAAVDLVAVGFVVAILCGAGAAFVVARKKTR